MLLALLRSDRGASPSKDSICRLLQFLSFQLLQDHLIKFGREERVIAVEVLALEHFVLFGSLGASGVTRLLLALFQD